MTATLFPENTFTLSIAVSAPVHAGMGSVLSYSHTEALVVGQLVRVPLGKREVLGVCMAVLPPDVQSSYRLKPIVAVLSISALSAHWCALIAFAARYYQREIGEVAMAALPPQLRELTNVQLKRRTTSKPAKTQATSDAASGTGEPPTQLNDMQSQAVAQFANDTRPALLFGATGSGKTEVYMALVAKTLATNPAAQALVLVPEINLTPQLMRRFEARFCPEYGPNAVLALNSGLTPAQRLKAWGAAHNGTARVILGTRLAVFASAPGLALIVVDEEHDPSYKSQDGTRYSARDLAVWRAKNEGIRVLLGSATPSLETWQASVSPDVGDSGRYMRLAMPQRIGAGVMPKLRLVDMSLQPKGTLLAPQLVAAIAQRAARGEQSLLLLNRRGYANALHCTDCGWKSECPACSAFQVFHKLDRSLRCHHCSCAQPVPKACPACGSLDLQMIGKGTERLEEHIDTVLRTEGENPQPLRIARIDADSTRQKGSLETKLAAVHGGEVDVLVGTQMLAKGHDFRRITLVAALGVDSSLFSSDYRAPERLFSLLTQVAGRAGRDASLAERSEIWVQTHSPKHPLFAQLATNDFEAFAAQQLLERGQTGLPPSSYHALLRCEARSQTAAVEFLHGVSQTLQSTSTGAHLRIYPPVPAIPQRVANIERCQMLVESDSRAALQRALTEARPSFNGLNPSRGESRVIRWAIDVDPAAI